MKWFNDAGNPIRHDDSRSGEVWRASRISRITASPPTLGVAGSLWTMWRAMPHPDHHAHLAPDLPRLVGISAGPAIRSSHGRNPSAARAGALPNTHSCDGRHNISGRLARLTGGRE